MARNDWFEWTDDVDGEDGRPGAGSRPPGPPPWVSGFLGLGRPGVSAGPKVRRGDVRMAILGVVHEAEGTDHQLNGYQVIQEIAERSGGRWKPSPGSVYPTIQQLHDEGLVESEDDRGRRTVRLTEDGRAYVAEHADEIEDVWRPFDRAVPDRDPWGVLGEAGQVMSAVWQIASQGSTAQKKALVAELAAMRRRLYGILADGREQER